MAPFKPGEVLVQKFGGSSVASPERILKIAERIAASARSGKRLAVVVSAMGDTTDDLIGMMQAVTLDPNLRELDQLMATGEIISCSLMVAALQKLGVRARSFNAFNLGILTDDRFGSAEIRSFERLSNLTGFLQPATVAVIAGFQGVTSTGDLTTLGRGGSDITAVALARELGQRVCEKFTDEDGVYTADPRVLPAARKVWHLDYDEMETLARYGNGILHPRAIRYGRQSSIRIHVRSSFTHEEGTVVGPDGDPLIPIKSIAGDKKQAVVRIEGIKVPVDPASVGSNEGPEFTVTAREWRPGTTGGSLRIGFKFPDAFDALPVLWGEAVRLQADDLLFNARLQVLSLVGQGLRTRPETVRHLEGALREAGIDPCLVEHEGIRLTLAVPVESSENAMQALHRAMMSVNSQPGGRS